MVFLRPKITRTPEQARALYNETRQKLPLINNWDQKPDTKKGTREKSKEAEAEPNSGG